MRLQTVSIILALFIGLGFQKVQAQIVASNPLEWMALAEGNELINNQIDKQINGQTKTAILQTLLPQSSIRYTSGKRSITAI